MSNVSLAPYYRNYDLPWSPTAEVEQRFRASGCPKINLQVRSGNASAIEFYRAIGYMPDDVVSMGKRLENDAGRVARQMSPTRDLAGGE